MDERRLLMDDVAKLASVMGRNLSKDALNHWADRLITLEPKSLLYRILGDFSDGPKMPALTEVLEAFNYAKRVRPEANLTPRLTEAEKKRADQSAIMSMLWLHYEKNWQLSDFNGHIMARSFGRNPVDALIAASEIFTREDIRKWMKDQQDAGN
jgi:hypothetical protein